MESNVEKYRILIIGGSGLIGRALSEHLQFLGHTISWIGRRAYKVPGFKTYIWDIQTGTYDIQAFQDIDICINLAGSSLSDGLWTAKRKADILQSRINAIELLEKGIKESNNRPKLIINGSAIGYYGSRPLEKLDESSSAGTNDTLSLIVQKWEARAKELQNSTDRMVLARTGLVLSKHGGIWPKLILTKAFRIFSWFGNGEQMYSWIHIHDYCKAITYIINHPSLSGPINLTAPHPISQKKLMYSIASALYSNSFCFGIPSFLLKLILGELASMLLTDALVLPAKLEQEGFTFEFPYINAAIEELIK